MIKIEIKIPDLERLGKALKAAVEDGARAAAHRLPDRITELTRAGLKPDGTAQPPNSEPYLELKKALGQGEVSGVATGLATDPRAMTVEEIADATSPSWRVAPPTERQDIIRWLGNRVGEWEFIGVPEKWIEELRAELAMHLERVR